MELVKKSWKFLIILAILGGFFGVYPYITARVVAGDAWQGLVPEFTGDNLYYMTRANVAIHEGVTGNPYYATAYDPPSPSFSIADNISGIPYAFLSPFWAVVWNAFFWNALFWILIGGISLLFGHSRIMIIASCFVVASSIFGYMIRVTNMQTIFPFFLLFFVLFLWTWRRDRLNVAGKYAPFLLGLLAGSAAYIHSFLFQVIGSSLFAGVLLALLLRRMRLVRSLANVVAVMIALAIPYFVYIYGVSDFPEFADTMNIFQGVRSHFLSPLVYFYGRWLVLLFMWSFLLWFTYRQTEKRTTTLRTETTGLITEDVALTIAAVSFGVLGVMVQNVITGVDIHAIGHANYFVHILLPLGLIFLTWPTIQVLRGSGVRTIKVLLLLCFFLVLIKVFSSIPAQFPSAVLYNPDRPDSAGPQSLRPVGSPQYIMPALMAIRSLSGTHVVAAPEPLSAYIPLYTEQYILFGPGAVFSVDTSENFERALTSKLGQPLTEERMMQTYDEFTGGARGEIFSRNKLARELCAMVSRSPSCSTLIVAQYFAGDGMVDRSRWFNYYQTVVSPNAVKYLHRFDVSQVVIDQRLPVPDFLREQTPWYSDQYYAIYDITELAP